MEPGLIWVLVGLAFLAAELFFSGFYLIWVGIAAIGTGILLLGSDAGFIGAAVTFLLLLGIGVFISVTLQRSEVEHHGLNAPEAGLVGRHAVVGEVSDIGLRVRLGDSDWPARLPRGVAMPAPGTAVRVEAVDGNTLVVRPDGSPVT